MKYEWLNKDLKKRKVQEKEVEGMRKTFMFKKCHHLKFDLGSL